MQLRQEVSLILRRLLSTFEGEQVESLVYELSNTLDEIQSEGIQIAFGWYKAVLEKHLSKVFASEKVGSWYGRGAVIKDDIPIVKLVKDFTSTYQIYDNNELKKLTKQQQEDLFYWFINWLEMNKYFFGQVDKKIIGKIPGSTEDKATLLEACSYLKDQND